jgi:hypothetical protein
MRTGRVEPRSRQRRQPDHSVGAGKTQIEHHCVVRRRVDRRVGLRALGEPVDRVSELAQAGGERIAELAIVLRAG